MSNYKRILMVHAVPQEQVPLPLAGAEIRTVVTGIGKVQAAMGVMQAALEFRPDLVLNVGTAGTLRHRVGDIIVSRHFVDRDLQRLQFPGLDSEVVTAAPGLEWPSWLDGRAATGDYVVNTGDDFVTADGGFTGDAVDMEAFAEAMVCRRLGLPFLAVKYVTDVVGQNSVAQWEDKLADARRGLSSFLNKYASFSG